MSWQAALEQAKNLLHPLPTDSHWTPYLGETLDCGMATLFAEEIIEALRIVYGLQPEPVPGLSWPAARCTSSEQRHMSPRSVDRANGRDR